MQKIGKLIGMLLIAVVFVVIPLYGCGDNVETVTNYDLDVNSVYGEIAGIYDGELTNSEVTGKGVFKDENDNFTYEGQFKQGIFKGQGKLSGTDEYERKLVIEGTFNGLDSIKGTITVDGIKEYEGSLSQYKHNSLKSYTLLVDDFVYHGSGTLYNINEEEVYTCKFKYGKPMDKHGFMNACKNYTSRDLFKYSDARVGSLVKYVCNNAYVDGSLVSNNNVFILDADRLSSSGFVSMLYQYHKGETRLVNGEQIVVYGILHGFSEDNALIKVLIIEEK